jgi:phage gp46-like protein
LPDVRIVSKADLQQTVADWLLLPTGALDENEELANYVKVALMTDALSNAFEVRPDPDSDDRRGWWGDLDAETIWRGWPIGCKNWLLTRAKITDSSAGQGDTAVRAENYCREALNPLIEMRLCSAIDVAATRVGLERIDVAITKCCASWPTRWLVLRGSS